MRRSLAALLAGMLVLTGPAATLAPAHAIVPPVAAPSGLTDSVVEVRSKRRKANRIRASRSNSLSSRYPHLTCGHAADDARALRLSKADCRGRADGYLYRHDRRWSYRDYDRRRYSDRRYENPRYYSRRYYDRDYSRRYHNRDNGAAVAAGIIGLAAGVIIGGQLDGGSSHAACARRYKSYDYRSGTYLGYDGRRHYCRLR